MPYMHILVAIDLSDECHLVMQRAKDLAQHNKAQLSIVHIIEPMNMAFTGDVPMDLALIQQQQMEQAQIHLSQLTQHYPEVSAGQCHLLFGFPRREIHNLATEKGCDLIVVGSHGRHGLALLLGSTANDVLHGAPCDVLAVRLKPSE